MSNRRVKVLASVIILLLTGIYSQAIPVNGEATRSISSREPCAPGDENQNAVASDDSDDESDDFVLLNGSLSSAAIELALNHESTVRSPSFLADTTLESQHILLRL